MSRYEDRPDLLHVLETARVGGYFEDCFEHPREIRVKACQLLGISYDGNIVEVFLSEAPEYREGLYRCTYHFRRVALCTTTITPT